MRKMTRKYKQELHNIKILLIKLIQRYFPCTLNNLHIKQLSKQLCEMRVLLLLPLSDEYSSTIQLFF